MAPQSNIIEQQSTEKSNKHLRSVALRTYSRNKQQSIENGQITSFLPMVPRIAHRVVSYLKPPLTFEDLVSAGTVGLVKAAKDFDSSYHTEFSTYAYIRVRGAILDELRIWSFVPANHNKQIRKAAEASQKIIEQTGHLPSDEQLAEKLRITLDELYTTFENARTQHFISIDGFGEDIPALSNILSDDGKTPEQQFEQTELINELAEAIEELPKKQRQIILLYYQQYLTMKQIAEVFEITEPRVSQLHAGALFNLSVKLRQWKNVR